MKSALIGYTGFVGRNLDNQFDFTHKYNSQNIHEIKNKSYDTVICSGIPASMWMANNFANKDLENIQNLLNILITIKTNQFVLISSTAVFKQPVNNVNEESICFEKELAYGKHRAYAEEFIKQNFNHSLIVRIPALFGNYLKKNFIYDLLNQAPAFISDAKFQEIFGLVSDIQKNILKNHYNFNQDKFIWEFNTHPVESNSSYNEMVNILKMLNYTSLNFTNSESVFQFYHLDNLWEDINIAQKNNISLLHLCSEPIKAKEIAKMFFNIDFNNDNGSIPFNYDMRTVHSKYWGKEGYYQYNKEDIIKKLNIFIKYYKR
jgi:dTDP-4-dehydrorhamnose reductase